MHSVLRASAGGLRAVPASAQLSASTGRRCVGTLLRNLQEPSGHLSSRPKPKVAATPEEAVAFVGDASNVFLHSAAATPTPLVKAMTSEAKRKNLKNISVFHMHVEGEAPYQDADAAPHFRSKSFFTGANARVAVNEGRGDYVPIFLSEIPLLFRRGVQKVDVALISVSPPDRHGFCSLGPSVDITRSALQVADKIVAMVNPRMPRTFGDASIHESHLDMVYHHEMPVHTLHKRKEGGPTEEAIGKLIADNLVSDGATLQMGIGAIPDAVLRHVKDRKDLGIHSEMVSDGVIDLVESGVVTNARKTIHPGKLTAGFAIGTERLYNFLNDNPGVVMRDIAFVNDTYNIARQPRMTAINSAIEVDITGQVVSDSIGTRIFSGVGGQMDFIRGAGLCEDGVPILALPSTTAKGESRIVDFLKPGGAVVTTRAHVHYLVTEYGIAQLWGKSLRERAAAIIGIAHPDHRGLLTKAARDRMLM